MRLSQLSTVRPTGCAALEPRGPHPAPVTGVATAPCGARGEPAEGDLDMPGYPGQYESEAGLNDGSGVHCARSRPTTQLGCPISINGFPREASIIASPPSGLDTGNQHDQ